jgi:hypothetical protein
MEWGLGSVDLPCSRLPPRTAAQGAPLSAPTRRPRTKQAKHHVAESLKDPTERESYKLRMEAREREAVAAAMAGGASASGSFRTACAHEPREAGGHEEPQGRGQHHHHAPLQQQLQQLLLKGHRPKRPPLSPAGGSGALGSAGGSGTLGSAGGSGELQYGGSGDGAEGQRREPGAADAQQVRHARRGGGRGAIQISRGT